MGTRVFLGGAHQAEWSHRIDHTGQLRQRRRHRLHVNLILEIRGRRADLARQREDSVRLGHIARQRLFADQALELCARTDGCEGLFERRDSREVGPEEGHDIDVRCHLRDASIHGTRPEAVAAHELGMRFWCRARDQSRHLYVTHAGERAQLKPGDETATDDAVTQSHFRLVTPSVELVVVEPALQRRRALATGRELHVRAPLRRGNRTLHQIEHVQRQLP